MIKGLFTLSGIFLGLVAMYFLGSSAYLVSLQTTPLTSSDSLLIAVTLAVFSRVLLMIGETSGKNNS